MSYDPRKDAIKVQGGKLYLPVKSVVRWFRQEHPDFGIDTSIITLADDEATFHCVITNDMGRLVSSGTKTVYRRDFGDYAEKAETGSIGRALGFLGYNLVGVSDELGADDGQEYDRGPHGETVGKEARPPAGPPPPPIPATVKCECSTCDVKISENRRNATVRTYGLPLCEVHMKAAYDEIALRTMRPNEPDPLRQGAK